MSFRPNFSQKEKNFRHFKKQLWPKLIIAYPNTFAMKAPVKDLLLNSHICIYIYMYIQYTDYTTTQAPRLPCWLNWSRNTTVKISGHELLQIYPTLCWKFTSLQGFAEPCFILAISVQTFFWRWNNMRNMKHNNQHRPCLVDRRNTAPYSLYPTSK